MVDPAEREGRPFAGPLVLALTLSLGAMFVLIPLAFVVHPSTHLSGILAQLGDQNQSVKTALYGCAFLFVAPASVLVALRLQDHLKPRSDSTTTATLPALSLLVAIIVARLANALPGGRHVGVVLAVAGCWALAAFALLKLAVRRRLPALGHSSAVGAVAGTLAIGAVLCVTSLRALNVPVLLAGGAAVAIAFLAPRHYRLPRLGSRVGSALEVIIVAIVLLAIPDLAIFKAKTPLLTALQGGLIQDQENYLLGPANQLLAGGTMLVDTVSQYGVASIYLLAGWFHLAPIGYGTLGFLDGVLNALVFACGYLVLRLAGAPRTFALCALALGVIALLYNLIYPVGALAEHGPLHFGLPIAAVLAVTAGARLPINRRRLANAATLLIVAVASIWSIEAFAYTLFTLAAMAAIWVLILPADARRRRTGRQLAAAAGACVVAQLLLAAGTLAAGGSLPHWGQYFAYFSAFVSGGVAQLTYGFARWSPGLAVGGLYLGSAVALAMIAARRRELLIRRPATFLALAGSTAYGIALFSYFDNRSATYLLLYVAFPALLVASLWLLVAMPYAPRYAMALGLALAAIVLAGAWHSVGARLPQSALAHVLPGDGSLTGALHGLWHPPAIDPRAPEGERLLSRYMPGTGRALVVLPEAADLQVEILMRAQRGNVVPIGDPIEDSIVPSARTSQIRAAIGRLRSGELLLTNRSGEQLLALLRAQPSYDPLAAPNPEGTGKLLDWSLKEIAARFALRRIASDKEGFVVVSLASKT